MSYLHKKNIINGNLKSTNILLDDFLLPKISDFYFFDNQKDTEIKGTSFYISPEMWKEKEMTKASDIYSFAILLYEIFTKEKPFFDDDLADLSQNVNECHRPIFKKQIGESYRNLIECCWAHDIVIRPTFDEILEKLKSDSGFITEKVNEKDFRDYVRYLDKCKNDDIALNPGEFIDFESETFKLKSEDDSFLSYKDFLCLNDYCRFIIGKASNDSSKLFYIAKSMIKGRDGFKKNVELGIKYLNKSMKEGNQESYLYYIKMLVKGRIIPVNQEEAIIINENRFKEEPSIYYENLGRILYSNKEYKKSKEMYLKSISYGNNISKYEYGRHLFDGQFYEEKTDNIENYEHDKNKEQGLNMIKESAEGGYLKAQYEYGLLLKELQKEHEHEGEHEGEEGQRNQYEWISYIKKSANSGYLKSIYFYSKILEAMNCQTESHEYLKNELIKSRIKSLDKYGFEYQFEDSEFDPPLLIKNEIDRNFVISLYRFTKQFYKSDKIPSNSKEAIKYLKIAINNGSINALTDYANLLQCGYGIQLSVKESLKYLRMAINEGESKAMNTLGDFNYNGLLLPQNYDEAYKYYKLSAEKGYIFGINNYGVLLFLGKGTPINKEESIKILKSAADKGFAMSMSNLGQILPDVDEANEYI